MRLSKAVFAGLFAVIGFAAAQTHQGHGAGAQAGGAGQSAGQSLVSPSDQKFMMSAAHGGLMEVQLAAIAEQNAESNEVKQFAQRLRDDHSKANDELKAIAAKRQVNLPTDPGPHQAQITKFQNMKGAEFDRAFARFQVQHHHKDVRDFQRYSTNGMDTDLKGFAAKQVPVLQEHLKIAEGLVASTRGKK